MNSDTRYLDGWFRAATDRMERHDWTILKTHDGGGGPLYLLFKGKTGRGTQTECIDVFKTAREAMDAVAYREERSAAFLHDVDIAEFTK